jgi:hypothetical protein
MARRCMRRSVPNYFDMTSYHNNFIWGGKKDRVKRTDLCRYYSKGGLTMIDIDQYLNSIKISWLKTLRTSTHMINIIGM